MRKVMVHSEAGGQGKTTTAVSVATIAATELNKKVVLIDLDPRGAATKWIGAVPKGKGLDVNAILFDEDPEGWAEEIAVPTAFSERLRIIPSDRSLSNREKDGSHGIETRLKVALHGLDADLVVIDCPNRQGGPLSLSALHAADSILYAASPSQDGVEGVEGSRRMVAEFRKVVERTGADPDLTEIGIVLGNVQETIMSRVAKNSRDELYDTGLLLEPLIPARTIVQEARIAGEWYGKYRKGAPIVDAYTQITRKVLR